MTNYTNAKIYKICGGDEVYIGSTCRELLRRFGTHKSKYNSNYRKCNSSILFEKYGIENCTIELIQDFPCESKKDLHEREGYYIRTMKCVNRFIAGRSAREYDIERYNEPKRKEYLKEYSKINKEKKSEYDKQRRHEMKLANGTAAAAAQIIEPIE
jgi:hypothetical protein